MPHPPTTATVSRSRSSADAPPLPWQALSFVGIRLPLELNNTAPNNTATASGLHTSRTTHDVVLSTVNRRLLVEIVRVVCTELAWSRSVAVGALGRMKFSAVFGSWQVSELAVSCIIC